MLRKHKSLTLLMLVMFVTSLFPASVMAGESAVVSPQVLNASTDPPETIRIEYAGDLTLKVKDKVQLTAVGEDANGNVVRLKKVSWHTTEPTVLAVDAKGKITAKKAGTATISVSTTGADGEIESEGLEFEVKDPNQVSRLEIQYDGETELNIGDAATLKAVAYNEDDAIVKSAKIKWSSDNADAVSVDSKGKIKAKGYGQATITALVQVAGFDDVTAELAFTVRDPNQVVELEIDYDSELGDEPTLKVGESTQLNVIGYDADGNEVDTVKNLKWSSSDAAVAKVDKSGKVTAKKAGSVTIRVSADGGVTAELELVVRDPNAIDRVEILYDGDRSINIGDQIALEAMGYSSDDEEITPKSVLWSSSDTKVATVDKKGQVKAKSAGMVTITAAVKTSNGTLTGEIELEVKDPNTSNEIATLEIHYDGDTALKVGQQADLVAVAYDEYYNEVPVNVVNWRSSDPSVASVDRNGHVVAKKVGTVSIIAAVTGSDGEVTAQLNFEVFDPDRIDSVFIQYNGGETLKVGEVQPITVIAHNINGQEVPIKNVHWKVEGDAGSVSIDPNNAPNANIKGVRVSANPVKIYAMVASGTAADLRTQNDVVLSVVDNGSSNQVAKIEIKADGPVAPDKAKVGDRIPVEAIAYDQSGKRVALNQVTWMSDNLNVVNFDAATLSMPRTDAICVKEGSASVTAQVPGANGAQIVSNSIKFNVTAGGQQSKITKLEVKVEGNTTIAVNGQVPVRAIGYDESGKQVNVNSVQWKSSPTGIVDFRPFNAPMSSIQGLAAGQTMIYAELPAQADGTGYVRSNDVLITVDGSQQQQIDKIDIKALGIVPPDKAKVGDRVPLEATAYDKTGNRVPLKQVTWMSDNGNVVKFDPMTQNMPKTFAICANAGSAVVTAQLMSTSGTQLISNPIQFNVTAGQQSQITKLEVRVKGNPSIPVNGQVPVEAIGYDATGQQVRVDSVQWKSSPGGIVDFNPLNAPMSNVRGLAAGQANIYAELPALADGTGYVRSNDVMITVGGSQQQVAKIEIKANGSNLSPVNAKVGDRVPLEAIGYDASGNRVPLNQVTWMSDNVNAVNFDAATLSMPNTQAVCMNAGNAAITAQVPGTSGMPVVSNTITFYVTGGNTQVASIELVAGGPTALKVGDFSRVKATLYDGNHNVITTPVTNLMFTSSNPGALVVDYTGQVKALAPATGVLVTASIPATGTSAALVSNPIYFDITNGTTGGQIVGLNLRIDGPSTLNVGQNSRVVVTAYDVNGATIPNIPNLTYTSSNPGALLVDNAGQVSAIAAGQNIQVTASIPAQGTTPAITSNPVSYNVNGPVAAKPARIEIKVNGTVMSFLHLGINQNARFEAIVYDTNNNIIPNQVVNWYATNNATLLVQNPNSPATDVIGMAAGICNLSCKLVVDGAELSASSGVSVEVN